MPRYLIEREVAGAGGLTTQQLRDIARRSNCAIEHMPGYVWEQTFVVGDRFYCVHSAPDEETVREHARRGGFPVTRITRIVTVIDPTTAEAPASSLH